MKWSAKRVESSGVPCLDAGSTPATSTLSLRFMSQAFLLSCTLMSKGEQLKVVYGAFSFALRKHVLDIKTKRSRLKSRLYLAYKIVPVVVVLFGVAEFLRVMHAEKFGDDILSFDPRPLHSTRFASLQVEFFFVPLR